MTPKPLLLALLLASPVYGQTNETFIDAQGYVHQQPLPVFSGPTNCAPCAACPVVTNCVGTVCPTCPTQAVSACSTPSNLNVSVNGSLAVGSRNNPSTSWPSNYLCVVVAATGGSSSNAAFTFPPSFSSGYYFVVVGGNGSLPPPVVVSNAPPVVTHFLYQLDCGGNGVPWLADSGTFQTETTSSNIDVTVDGMNAPPQSVLKNAALNPTYTIAVPNPTNIVTFILHNVEYDHAAARVRLETIFIMGQPVTNNFDIYASAGALAKDVPLIFKAVPINGVVTVQVAVTPNVSSDPHGILAGLELSQ
jgi:hypothetical protein